MRTLRSPSQLVVLCIALLLAAGATSVMASKGAPDRKAPKLSLKSPANGSATFDTTPRLAGRAGHAAGDRRTVSVRVYLGAKATGRPQRVLTARRKGASWAVNLAPALLPGTYTAKARQLDGSGNRGASRASTFTIERPLTVAKPPVKVSPPPPGKPVTPPAKPPVVPPPAVAITSPAAGAETSDSTPSFAAGVTDATGEPERSRSRSTPARPRRERPLARWSSHAPAPSGRASRTSRSRTASTPLRWRCSAPAERPAGARR